MEFGDILKTLRTEKKIGLNQLARWSGVPASYISLLEQGKRNNPSIPILFKITKGLSMTENETIRLIRAMNKPEATPSTVQEDLLLGNTTPLTDEQGAALQQLCLTPITKCLIRQGGILTNDDFIYITDVVERLVSHLANKPNLADTDY